MVKAVFADFYGTIVHEDEEVIKFMFALEQTGLSPEQIVHIGDSLSSDIKGASLVGIETIWINRGGREVPDGVHAVGNLLEVLRTGFFH